MIEVSLAQFAHERMERARVSHRSRQRFHLGKPVSGDNPMLRQMAAQCVDQLGSLSHQQVAGPKDHGSRLLLFRLQRHKRIVGLEAASTIASASAASFFWRRTNGLT